MLTVATIIFLGLLTNTLVLNFFLETPYPRFSSKCSRCGYQPPLMEYPIVIDACPGCTGLDHQSSKSDDFHR